MADQVLYMSLYGCAHLSLPLFVDDSGTCHASFDAQVERTQTSQKNARSEPNVRVTGSAGRSMAIIPLKCSAKNSSRKEPRALTWRPRNGKQGRKGSRSMGGLRVPVLFGTLDGGFHVSLPLFVDGSGQCHAALIEKGGKRGEESLALGETCSEKDESGTHVGESLLTLEHLVLQEILLRAMECEFTGRRRDGGRSLSKMEKDALTRELWNEPQFGLADDKTRRQELPAPKQLSSRCNVLLQGRRPRHHTLQQPRAAVY
eukprot:TRINITY_DN257_c0_g1_i1.p1 TRINITY_DN257_c0_g1~~TRINITY_DN257_c0_g1_i1.p1  ORF type:complete len:259 (-),score=20.42 TRINITY_DN257_c0_g1_i1:1088-1864(-)